jgi:hypothetical protein
MKSFDTSINFNDTLAPFPFLKKLFVELFRKTFFSPLNKFAFTEEKSSCCVACDEEKEREFI